MYMSDLEVKVTDLLKFIFLKRQSAIQVSYAVLPQLLFIFRPYLELSVQLYFCFEIGATLIVTWEWL